MFKLRELVVDTLLAILVFITATAAIMTPALLAQQIIRGKVYAKGSAKKVEVYYSKDSERCFTYLSGGEKKVFRTHREASNYATTQKRRVLWVLLTPAIKAEVRRIEQGMKEEVKDGK
jgi:hypothetical protein